MKRSKIHYIPGIISLIFLPILCIWYLNNHKNELRTLDVYYASKFNPDITDPLKFDTTCLSSIGHKRKYIEIRVNRNLSESKNFLQSLNYRSTQIINHKDTLNGIHIVFENDISYNTYIKILDVFNEKSKYHTITEENYAFKNNLDLYAPVYLLFENHLWFHNYKYPRLIKPLWECHIQCIVEDYKPTVIEKFYNQLEKNKILLRFWPFFLLIIGFLIISLRYIRRIYK